MNDFWRRFLALTLGLGLSSAVVASNPTPTPPAPPRWGVPAQQQQATQPQWPGIQAVSYNPTDPVEPPRRSPAVTLDRPIAIVPTVPVPEPLPTPEPAPLNDGQVQPTGYNPTPLDPITGRAVSVRPEAGQMSPNQFGWKPMGLADSKDKVETGPAPKPEPLPNPPMPVQTAPAPLPLPTPIPNLGTPVQGIPIQGAPIYGTPIQGAPLSSQPLPLGQPSYSPAPLIGTSPYMPGPGPVGGPILGPTPGVVSTPVHAMPGPMAGPMPMASSPGANLCPPGNVCPPAPCPAGNFSATPFAYGTPTCGIDPMDGCCYTPFKCFYVSAEYLMWWTAGASPPPLVTTGSTGIIGRSDTLVLHGEDQILTQMRSGGRITGGMWFDETRCFGLDLSAFFLGQTSEPFGIASTGSPNVFRPLTDTTTGQNISQITALPGVASGAINIDHTSELYGWEANFRTNILCWKDCYIDMLLGYRGLVLDEQTSITELVNSTNANIPGSSLQTDIFKARSTFNGGQIGIVGEHRFLDNWSFAWRAKLAMGTTRQTVNVNGATLITGSNGSDGLYPVGILAQGNYLGQHSRSVFSVVPEVQFDVGYQFNQHVRAFVGYNFLYWSNVARASEQINTNVNPGLFARSPVSGASNPNPFNFNSGGYWAQGMNFGVEFRW